MFTISGYFLFKSAVRKKLVSVKSCFAVATVASATYPTKNQTVCFFGFFCEKNIFNQCQIGSFHARAVKKKS